MRRFLLLLIGLMALGTLLPGAPAAAAMPMPHHGHAMPPGHCDEGQGAIHMCLGCAVDVARPAAVAPMAVPPGPLHVIRLVAFVEGRRPGFDPPPPRAG